MRILLINGSPRKGNTVEMLAALDPGDILKIDGAVEELESFWQKLV